jgi:hypothetical protein
MVKPANDFRRAHRPTWGAALTGGRGLLGWASAIPDQGLHDLGVPLACGRGEE